MTRVTYSLPKHARQADVRRPPNSQEKHARQPTQAKLVKWCFILQVCIQDTLSSRAHGLAAAVRARAKVSCIKITSRLLKYFPASQTSRTRLFSQCARVAAIIHSSDLRGSQSNFIHSRRTRDACEATGLVTRVVASMTKCITKILLTNLV